MLFAVPAFAAPTPWAYPEWADRTRISFAGLSTPPAGLADGEWPIRQIVVSVRLRDGVNFAHPAGSTGADLRFTNRDGLPLYHEVEAWNDAGESRIWVRVPQILGPDDAIWMYTGNDDADDTAHAAGTWDEWDLVLHFGDLADPRGPLPIDTFGPVTRGNGHLGDALRIGPWGGAIVGDLPHDEQLLTVETLVRVEGWDRDGAAIVSRGVDGWQLGRCGDEPGTAIAVHDTDLCGRTPIVDNEWHTVGATYDGARLRLFVDGRLEAHREESGPIAESPWVVVGNIAYAFRHAFGGSVDELRIGRTSRSARWMAADAASMHGTLVSYCNEFGGAVLHVPDLDGDGAIGRAEPVLACEAPFEGWVAAGEQPEDCDDRDPRVYPGADEDPGDPDLDCDRRTVTREIGGGACATGGPAGGFVVLILGLSIRWRPWTGPTAGPRR